MTLKALQACFSFLTGAVYVAIVLSLLIAAPIMFGLRPVVVLSGSMEPAMPVGSIIYYKPATFEEISSGDAITFSIGEGSLATHRVIEVHEEDKSFTTKGDANPSEDTSPVLFSNVAGRALDVAIPYAGYFITYSQNWYVIAGMGLVLVIGLFITSNKEKAKAKRGGGAKREEASEITSSYRALGEVSGENTYRESAFKKSAPASKKEDKKPSQRRKKEVKPEEYFKDF